MGDRKIRVIIVDDYKVVRRGLTHVIRPCNVYPHIKMIALSIFRYKDLAEQMMKLFNLQNYALVLSL